MRIVAICGSLRAASSNAALLRAAARLAPAGVSVELWEGLDALPHFNPDLDEEGAIAPPEVAAFRAMIGAADGLLISSPEYAHGVPGALKNAIDWLVSSPEILGKPVVLLNAAPLGGEYAQAQLEHTLTTMNARVVRIPQFVKKKGDYSDAKVEQVLRAALAAFPSVGAGS